MRAKAMYTCLHTDVAVPDTARPPRPYRFGEEPFLLLWQRPSNPVEPHFQHNVAVPSTPDRRNDHRVIFRVGFFNSANETGNMVCHDFSDVTKVYVEISCNLLDSDSRCQARLSNSSFIFQRAPSYEVRLKVNKVYRFKSGKGKSEPEELGRDARAKCIRFWKDIYRQPKSGEEKKNEISFWLRFKNPQDAHKIIVYLKFDLLMKIPEGFALFYKLY